MGVTMDTKPFEVDRKTLKTTRKTAFAPVAQGIEHWFPKPVVAGSNPAGGAFDFCRSIGIQIDAAPFRQSGSRDA